eukprot:gb/GEZN01005079.1/.p1 GENE.gb/GEZN01005079.1/~~gb/GEZN01005079.1/.p1  ORF type:complete len:515 (-),score=97.09 gb/GEZN01005079.1/:282-1826(-)
MSKMISMEEVRKHNTAEDCWCVINGKVYNLTSFLGEHPAGPDVIANCAGKDATAAFEPFHPEDIMITLGKADLLLGPVDPSTVKPSDKVGDPLAPAAAASAAPAAPAASAVAVVQKAWEKPPLDQMLNIADFESVARRTLSVQGWSYYSSGSDDEITLRENMNAFRRIWFRPRILINVKTINMSTKILGYSCSIPLYITATAVAKLADKDGELALSRAAGNQGVVYMVPTLSSYSLDQMLESRPKGATQFFQLYVNADKKTTQAIVKKAEDGGVKALCITVDAPQLGRREKDMRVKVTSHVANVQNKDDKEGKVDRSQGVARAISSFIDPSLNWKDIEWFKTITKLPLILKGVQCGEDAVLAYQRGCRGVVLSNHGGRQLDFARSGIEILPEVMTALKAVGHKGRDDKFEVWVDGGVRRGTDIFKAIALGAKCVGVGRPTLFALAAYGQDGVERALQLMKDELEMCMRLAGTPTIDDITENHVDARALGMHTLDVPPNSTYDGIYEKLQAAGKL